MPNTYTVTAVSPETRQFTSQYGPMISYRLHLRNGDGTDHLNVELVRKQETRAPQVGDTFDGDLEQREQYGPKLKLAKPPPGGGGGNSSARPEDPKRAAAIQRMHSQTAAVTLLQAKAAAGLATEADFSAKHIASLADWFDLDANAARDAA